MIATTAKPTIEHTCRVFDWELAERNLATLVENLNIIGPVVMERDELVWLYDQYSAHRPDGGSWRV